MSQQITIQLQEDTTSAVVSSEDGVIASAIINVDGELFAQFILPADTEQLTVVSTTSAGVTTTFGPVEIKTFVYVCDLSVETNCTGSCSGNCASCIAERHCSEGIIAFDQDDALYAMLNRVPEDCSGESEEVTDFTGTATFEPCSRRGAIETEIPVTLVAKKDRLRVPLTKIIPNVNYRVKLMLAYDDPCLGSLTCCRTFLVHVNGELETL